MKAISVFPAAGFADRTRREVMALAARHRPSDLAEAMGVTRARVAVMLKQPNWTLATVEKILRACAYLSAAEQANALRTNPNRAIVVQNKQGALFGGPN